MNLPTRDSVKGTICRIGSDGKGYCERSGPEGNARIPVRREGEMITPTGDGEGSKDALIKLYSDFSKRKFKVRDNG